MWCGANRASKHPPQPAAVHVDSRTANTAPRHREQKTHLDGSSLTTRVLVLVRRLLLSEAADLARHAAWRQQRSVLNAVIGVGGAGNGTIHGLHAVTSTRHYAVGEGKPASSTRASEKAGPPARTGDYQQEAHVSHWRRPRTHPRTPSLELSSNVARRRPWYTCSSDMVMIRVLASVWLGVLGVRIGDG